MGAEVTISDSATETPKIGNDGRCFGLPPGCHLPELSLGSLDTSPSREMEDFEVISRAAAIYKMTKAC